MEKETTSDKEIAKQHEKHEQKMEVKQFYAGILVFTLLAVAEIIFDKAVPVQIWIAGLVVSGIKIDKIAGVIAGKK